LRFEELRPAVELLDDDAVAVMAEKALWKVAERQLFASWLVRKTARSSAVEGTGSHY